MKTGNLVSRKYRLLRRLAEGGMGEVWSARNERTNREFAIKFLLPALARNPEALHRFVREAKATGQLRHPNIVTAIDAGMHEGRPYLVMELLSGESLEDRLTREGALDDLETCILLAQVARALDHAHTAGLVHRDLSAANVYLSIGHDEGPAMVKVLDFGVTKVLGANHKGRVRTGDGSVLGSPAYMSPEQARGDLGVDARSDIWSLGVLMYECLSGRLPFEAANYNALMHAIANVPIEPLRNAAPHVDEALLELVDSCLVKDCQLRIGSAEYVFEQLERIAHRLSQQRAKGTYLPLRREVDRIRTIGGSPGARWFARRALPKRVLPLGVRVWRRLGEAPRAVAASLALVMGVGLGVATASLRVRSNVDESMSSPKDPAECRPHGGVSSVVPARSKKRATSTKVTVTGPVVMVPPLASSSLADDTDLVRAMARSLSVPESNQAMQRTVSRNP